jgi:hypothetical protein
VDLRDPRNGYSETFPALAGGRVKPLDSIARNGLLVLSGKQTVHLNERRITATGWLMDMVFRPSLADVIPVFEIDDPDVLGLFGIQQSAQRRYSFLDLQPHLGELQKQAGRAEEVRPERRSRYQGAVLRLWGKVILYWRLQNSLQLADPDAALPGVSKQTQEVLAYETALADPRRSQKIKRSTRSDPSDSGVP